MPSVSRSQQRLMAACSHGVPLKQCPEHLSKAKMREFAATPRKGLPERKGKR